MKNYFIASLISVAIIFTGCGYFYTDPTTTKPVGWAVGGDRDNNGYIFHTADGGTTWVTQWSSLEGVYTTFSGVAAIDSKNAWVVGGTEQGYGVILRTYDGGNTWVRQGDATQIPNVELLEIGAVDNNYAWIVGYSGTILRTTDGGNNWIQQTGSEVPNVALQGIAVLDHMRVWASGDKDSGYGTILHTTNGGDNWIRQGNTTQVPDVFLIDIDAYDRNNVWAVGHQFTFLRSTDGGSTWEDKSFQGSNYDANDVAAIGAASAWVVEDNDGIYRTDDGGTTWTTQEAPLGSRGNHLLSISAIDANTAWAVGTSFVGAGTGVILHTTDAGLNWIAQTLEVSVGLVQVSFVK